VYKDLPSAEEAFKKRYNRDIKASLLQQRDGKKVIANVKIISPKGKEYILRDTMVEGSTVEANLIVGDKEYKYKRYIDCEIHCADLIGEE
jgi:hypothetical protein